MQQVVGSSPTGIIRFLMFVFYERKEMKKEEISHRIACFYMGCLFLVCMIVCGFIFFHPNIPTSAMSAFLIANSMEKLFIILAGLILIPLFLGGGFTYVVMLFCFVFGKHRK